MKWTYNYHHTDKCNRPMVGLHKYLISLLFCWQAKLPDIEKCLDIVAALQAKKALGEVFPVSEKPNYLLLHFLSWYCTIVEGCTLALRRTKCYSFDALPWSVGYFTLLEGTRLLLCGSVSALLLPWKCSSWAYDYISNCTLY